MSRLPGPRSPVAQARWARALSRDLYGGVLNLYRRYGPVVEFGVGPLRYVYLFGREANEHILATDPDGFLWRDGFRVLVPVVGDTALVVTDGSEHARLRRLVQPAFGRRHIEGHVALMQHEIDRIIDDWTAGAVVDAYADLRLAVRRIVILALFGERLRVRADELGELLQGALDFVNLPVHHQLVHIDRPFTRYGRAMRARRRADEIVYAEIARRRVAPHASAGSGGEGGDVLDLLLGAGVPARTATADSGCLAQQEQLRGAESADGDGGLSDTELRDQVVSLVAAGYDTTSAAVGWAVHELVARADMWHKLATEVAEVVGDDPITPEVLPRLVYLDGVVREVLRLHAAAVVARRSLRDFEIAGYKIPAGRMVLYSPYVTHRLPELWPEPLAFRPERWLPDAPGYVEPPPFASVPFGGGYRRCIGFGLARFEIKIAVVRLVQRTALEPLTRHIAATGVAANTPAGGVPVRVTEVRVTSRHHQANPGSS
jgi:cytochrome P450